MTLTIDLFASKSNRFIFTALQYTIRKII